MNITGHIGRLTADPELYPVKDGHVCTFTLAVKVSRDKAIFIQCKAWNERGLAIHKYFKKGQPIGVKGHLGQDKWEDSAGNKRERIYIEVEEFDFAGEKKLNTEVNDNVEDDEPAF